MLFYLFLLIFLGPTVLNHHLNSRLPGIADLPSPQNIHQLPPPASPTERCQLYVCQLCMHSFPTYTALYSHHIAMHSISSQQLTQPMLCPHCLIVVPSPAELVLHIQAAHTQSPCQRKDLKSPKARDVSRVADKSSTSPVLEPEQTVPYDLSIKSKHRDSPNKPSIRIKSEYELCDVKNECSHCGDTFRCKPELLLHYITVHPLKHGSQVKYDHSIPIANFK